MSADDEKAKNEIPNMFNTCSYSSNVYGITAAAAAAATAETDDTDRMVMISEDDFMSDHRIRMGAWYVMKPLYFYCAKYIMRMAKHFDYDEWRRCRKMRDPNSHTVIFDSSVVAHSLKLLAFWLCAMYYKSRCVRDALEDEEDRDMEISDLESVVQEYICSQVDFENVPRKTDYVDERTRVVIAGTCLMTALKCAHDEDVLATMSLSTLQVLDRYVSETRTASLYFACVFLSKTALSFASCLRGDDIDTVTVTVINELRDEVNIAEMSMLTRLQWNVNARTETQYVDLFFRDLESFVLEARMDHLTRRMHTTSSCDCTAIVAAVASAATSRNLETLRLCANANALKLLSHDVEELCDVTRTVPCWMNGMCAVLLAIEECERSVDSIADDDDDDNDGYHHKFVSMLLTLRKKLLEKRVGFPVDRQYILIRCRKLRSLFRIPEEYQLKSAAATAATDDDDDSGGVVAACSVRKQCCSFFAGPTTLNTTTVNAATSHAEKNLASLHVTTSNRQ